MLLRAAESSSATGIRKQIWKWLHTRVRAHVFLCMLAYYVEWHMRNKLAPLLFDDHDNDPAQAQRQSIVKPAKRSPAAERKALTKQTVEGKPVHSFQSLLADLATLTIHRVQPANKIVPLSAN